MKNIVAFFFLMFALVDAQSQQVTNADGTPKFRANIAILVDVNSYTFSNGVYKKVVGDEETNALKIALRTLCMERAQMSSLAVVNRDDDAYQKVATLLEENRLEDYLSGVSITAKNQGADYIMAVNCVIYGRENTAVQMEVSTRLINVATNMGYHTFHSSETFSLKNEEDIANKTKNVISDINESMNDLFLTLFPEQYYIAKGSGKTLYLGAYQPNAAIYESDEFYAFRLTNDALKIGNQSIPLQTLQYLSTCSQPAMSEGYMKVKSDKSISDNSNVVLFKNIREPIVQGSNQMTITFFGFPTDLSFNGLIQSRINNAIYNAITVHPMLQLIETDHIAELKEERELQKSEDFIDGHVVEQMKAFGAQYLVHIENFSCDGSAVSFDMSFISVSENKIVRTVSVETTMDNIEGEVYQQICQRFAYYCNLRKIREKEYEMLSPTCLRQGTEITLRYTKPTVNVVTKETIYTKVEVCSATVKQGYFQKCLLKIDSVMSKEDMDSLVDASQTGAVTFAINRSDL